MYQNQYHKHLIKILELRQSSKSCFRHSQLTIIALPSSIVPFIKANVSLDLLFKRKNREITFGYIGKEICLHEYDYKKEKCVPTSMTYALDKNLEPLKDKNLIIIRYKKPIYELNLPNDAILFITEESYAMDLGTTKKSPFL